VTGWVVSHPRILEKSNFNTVDILQCPIQSFHFGGPPSHPILATPLTSRIGCTRVLLLDVCSCML
jgi:hypothetical protein